MIHRFPRPTLSVIILAALVGCSLEQGSPTAKQPQKNMADIKLTLNLSASRILVGETLEVTVSITNLLEREVELPDPAGGNPFDYLVRPAKGEGDHQLFSARRAADATSKGLAPPIPTSSKSLPSGGELKYGADLASFMGQGLAGGNYLVSASFRLGEEIIESEPVSLHVARPRVAAIALSSSSRGELGLIFAHHESDDSYACYQQESEPGRPLVSASQRRLHLQKPQQITSVAGATKWNPDVWERWYAWIQSGESVGGGLAWGKASYFQGEAVAMGIKNATLHPVGWQSANSALFVAMGIDANEKVSLALVTMRPREEIKVSLVTLPNPSVPNKWVAQAELDNDGVKKLHLVTVDAVENGQAIHHQVIRVSEATAEPIAKLIDATGPVLAISSDTPETLSKPGYVSALFDSGKEENPLSIHRLPLADGEASTDWNIPYPENSENKRPDMWAIGSSPKPDPVVIARLDRTLMSRRGGGGEWQTISPNAGQAQYLQVRTLEDIATVFWWEPGLGIQTKPAP